MPENSGILAKQLTSSGQVTTANKGGLLFCYNLSGGTTASSVTFTDGGASGTTVWVDSIKAQTAAGDATVNVTFPFPLVFTKDVYATIAGTGATICAGYKQINP